MTQILHLKSSSNVQGSTTRQVGPVVMESLKARHPGAKIIERDLVAGAIPHISPQFLGAMFAGNGNGLELSDQMITELLGSDILVIESPMYNFSIPSALKAWIDHVVRAGKTFQYGANGPEGLAKGKKAILVLGSGGVYSDGAAKAMDFQEPYLRTILGFIGITDIETIRIEGVAFGPEQASAALEKAKRQAISL